GAGQSAVLADRIDQGPARFDLDPVVAAVDGEKDVAFVVHGRFSTARSAARMRCGVAGISLISTPNGAIASLMALSTAAGAPMVPPSPTPFARVMVASLIVSRWCSSIGGISRAVGGKKSASVEVSTLPVAS